MKTRLDFTQASMYANDPIVLEAADRVNATRFAAPPTLENEYIDFEQLLREADPNREDAHVDEGGGLIEEINRLKQSSNDFPYFWRRKSTSASSNERLEPRLQSTFLATTNVPQSQTIIRHDKYVVKISIPITTNEISDIREVVDIMANMDLLYYGSILFLPCLIQRFEMVGVIVDMDHHHPYIRQMA